MPMPPSDHPATGEVTRLLAAVRAGDSAAVDRLFPLVHDELRVIAARLLRREAPGHTLEPTELVHEAYLRLGGAGPAGAENRAHFLGIAARAMRHLLVDHARRRKSAKRGGGVMPLRVSSAHIGVDLGSDELLALDEALERLSELEPRLRQVVECRFFGGLTEDETAATLGVTSRTVQRDWAKARAWLYKELYAAGE